MSEQVVTKDNYKQVVLKRMIAICWFILGLCFLVKIFGGNFFVIICENENFIKICDYIESSFLYYVIGYLNYVITHFIMFFYICPETKIKSKQVLAFFICFSLLSLTKIFTAKLTATLNPLLCSLVEWAIAYLFFVLISKRKLKSLFALVYINAFMIISMFVKNLSLTKIIADDVITTLIYMIDYYIMLIIIMLYSKTKNNKNKEN